MIVKPKLGLLAQSAKARNLGTDEVTLLYRRWVMKTRLATMIVARLKEKGLVNDLADAMMYYQAELFAACQRDEEEEGELAQEIAFLICDEIIDLFETIV